MPHEWCYNQCMSNEPVFFYEREFYVFSNFSSFAIFWKGLLFPTSEHAYHWEKFVGRPEIQSEILFARSAHDALKIAHENKDKYIANWDELKLYIMTDICRAKLQQHPYVMKKLMQTGGRLIIEDSWRDDYWGWGPNQDGHNHLGEIWMKLRDEINNVEM